MEGSDREAAYAPIPVATGIAAIVSWIAAVFAVMICASYLVDHQLEAWRPTTPAQTFWGTQGSGIRGIDLIMLFVLLGIWLLAAVIRQPRGWGPALVALLVAEGAVLLFLGQARYAITPTHLIVHPLAPWRAAVQVPLSATTVVERGCARTYRRSNTVVFRVQYGPAADDVVNLGSAVGWRNNQRWLDAMRVYSQSRSLPPQDTREHASLSSRCLSATSFGLNDEQRLRLRRLLE